MSVPRAMQHQQDEGLVTHRIEESGDTQYVQWDNHVDLEKFLVALPQRRPICTEKSIEMAGLTKSRVNYNDIVNQREQCHSRVFILLSLKAQEKEKDKQRPSTAP
jgi:hypothetical protein